MPNFYNDENQFWKKVRKNYPDFFKQQQRENDRIRSRQKARGECCCPRDKWFLCIGVCVDCQFRQRGRFDSLSDDDVSDNGESDRLIHLRIDIEIISKYVTKKYGSVYMEVFRMQSEGKKMTEISDFLGIKNSTLDEHIKKIRKDIKSKFGDKDGNY